ncbi:MAG: hypothetical protein WDO71_05205 [Bacteroidota bacterium]
MLTQKPGNREKALDIIRKMEQRQLEEPDSVIDNDMAAVWYSLATWIKHFIILINAWINGWVLSVIFLNFLPITE